jgi:hypothetical protein
LGCCTVTSCFQSQKAQVQTVDSALTAHEVCPRCDEPIVWNVTNGYVGVIAEYTCKGFVHPECGEYGK